MENVSPLPEVSFKEFLEIFPVIELPITLNDEALHEFSNINDPLPARLIDHFIVPYEEELPDELTEFIACFRIPETHNFQAIVYWKAGLMTYEYTLATYTNRGELLDKRVIAGTFYDGEHLTQSVAIVEDDWEILIMSGQSLSATNGKPYDAKSSRISKMELLPEGQIIDIGNE